MKKKMTYFAPETEQMDIKFEQNIMSVTSETVANMTTHNASEWGDWE